MNESCSINNSSQPLFSVVVPVYNVEPYINKCIDSLCSQLYDNIEIILVDDGSKDSSGYICDEYAKKNNNIKVIHKKNEGIVIARQTGVEQSTGRYIACIDGDDWVSDEYFLKFKEIVDEYNPDIACCCYYEAFTNHNNIVKHKCREGYYSRTALETEIFPILLCGKNGESFSSSLWGKIFRKEIYRQQQLVSVSVSMGEDDACVKPTVFHAMSMYVFNEPLYYYRQNYESVSKARRAFSWDGPEIRAIHLSKKLELEKYDLQNQLYRSLVFSVFTVTVSQFDRNISKKDIIKDIKCNLKRPLYDRAIKRCHFKGCIKGSFRLIVLKYRLYIVMNWYNNRYK